MLIASNDATDIQRQIRVLAMPWEAATLSFDHQEYTPAAIAFGTGLVQGRSELLGHETDTSPAFKNAQDMDWSNSEWKDYYTFGRWSLLSWSLAKSNKGTANDWIEIKTISDQLLHQFQQRPIGEQHAQLAVQALKRVDPTLVAMGQQPSQAHAATISRRLEMTMQQFFPN